MSRMLRMLAVLSLIVGLLALPVGVPGAMAAPDQVTGIELGLSELSDWWGALESEGRLGAPLPLLETSLGEGLDVSGAFDAALKAKLASAADPATVTALAAQVEGFDGPVTAGPSGDTFTVNAAFSVTNIDDEGPVYGFDLVATLSRTISAARVDITAPPTASTPEVQLESASGAGVPLDLSLTATFSPRYDSDQDYFSVLASDGGTPTDAADDLPRVDASATVNGVTLGSDFKAAIGVGDIEMGAGSTMDLDETFLVDVVDSNGDGELAFEEPSTPGGSLISAELRLPPSQNVAVTTGGSATTTLNLQSPIVPGTETATLTASTSDLSGAYPVPAVSGASIEELAQFGNVQPVDLLNGLVQYATLLRGLQVNPNVDFDLPLVRGKLSDIVLVHEELAAFIDDRVQEIPPGADLSADPNQLVDFQTVQDLIAKMEASGGIDGLKDTNGADTGKISPQYDDASNKLTLALGVTKALDGSFQPLPTPDPNQPAGFDTAAGLPEFGAELRPFSSLAGGSPGALGTTDAPATSPAQRKTAYDFEMPLIVNLADSAPTTDDPQTDGVVEFEDPMVFERFETSTAAAQEMTLTGVLRSAITANGTIGFVGVDITGSGTTGYNLDQLNASTPMVTVNVDAIRAGASPTLPIGTLLEKLVDDDGNDDVPDDPEDTSNDPVVPAQPSAKLDSVLQIQAPGPQGENYFLTDNPGTITIAWPSISTALAQTNVTLDATAQMLKDLDIVPPDFTDPNSQGSPSALLGKLLDTIDNVTDKIDGLPGASGLSNDLLNTKLPLVGKSASDLFSAADKLAQEIDDIRTGETPITLQDLESKLQDALGLNANALNFGLKDAISGGKPELIFRLSLGDSLSQQVPLNIDMPASFGGANIAGVQGTGTLQVQAEADLNLNVPVTLDAPSASDLTAANPMILNSSGLEVSASATGGENVSLTANLGPLSVSLGPNPGKTGSAGQLAVGAQFSAYPNGTAVPQNSEVAQSFDDFKNSLAPRLEGGDPNNNGDDFTCTPQDTTDSSPASPPEVVGQIGCLAMPVSISGLDLGADPDERYLTVVIDEGAALGDLPQLNVSPPPALTVDDLLASLPNFGSMKDGVTKLKAILQLALQGATFGAQLPLVGDEIAAGAKVIEKVQALVENPLGSLPGLPNDLANTRVDWVLDNIRPAVYDGLCPSGPADCLLRDSGYQGPGPFYPSDSGTDATETDIRVVMLCDGDKHVCALDDPATTDADDDDPNTEEVEGTPGDENEAEAITDLREVTFEFELGQGSRNPNVGNCTETGAGSTPCEGAVSLPFDMGLPGLNIEADGSVEARAGWSLQLGFGVNNEVGFFILDNPLPSTGTPDDGADNDVATADADDEQELKVGFGVGLAQNAGDPEIDGAIGFLDVNIEDQAGSDGHESLIAAAFDSDLAASGDVTCDPTGTTQRNCSRRLTIDQIPGLDAAQTLNPKLSADADLDLELKSGIVGSVGEKLPKVRADFLLNWEFGSPGSSSGSDPDCGTAPAPAGDGVSFANIGAPRVCFNNVGIDPGTLFGNTLNPIFSGIKKFTEPVDPIREFIFAPLPVISDISRLFGGGDITFVDLAEIFGEVDLSLLEDINTLIDFINNLPTATGDFFAIGDFEVLGQRAKAAATTPDQVTSLIQGGQNTLDNAGPPGGLFDSAKNSITDTNKKQKFQNIVDSDSDPDADISLPILDEPGCVFGMIFGGDCTIFEYDPDPLEMRFDYEQSFGPFFGVLYVTLGGFAGARADISLGFDTRGFRELYESIKAGNPVQDAEDVLGAIGKVLNGIYLGDLNDAGEDINELEVFAGITAGAKLSILIAEFGARGGVEATVGLNLHDGPEVDGKLRINEIINKIAVPWCLFDVTGRLEAFLEVYMTLGVCPFCVEKDFELARVILLEFSESCPETPPDLADSDGTNVVLNVGVDAGNRGAGYGGGGDDENFVVRETSPPGASPKTFSITAFGFTQKESGERIVIRDAQGGNDSFLFQGVKQEGATPGQNAGTPGVAAPFTAPVFARLGAGNDAITTGTAADHVEGGADTDTINVGPGNDGRGSLPSGLPAGSIGSAGVRGGSEPDTIIGDAGNDNLFGDEGNDTLDAGLGADDADGGTGNDLIQGGADLVVRPDQATPCPATPCDQSDGGDDLVGGPGQDQIDGGNGNDDIWGDEGSLNDDSDGVAPASAGDNNDTITGGLGVDDVFAGSGDDTVNGGGDGTVVVDPSRDRLHGNGGNDQLFGRDGNDNVWGGNGDDQLMGDAGHDNLFGQGDEDKLFGAGGDDDAYGGDGADDLFGQADEDDLSGGANADTVFGGDSDDVIVGDDGTIDDGDVADDPGSTNDSDAATRTESISETSGAGDRLFGESGNDRMFGEGGTDEMLGGSGTDFMHGNGAADEMFGDNDDDEMYGDGAADLMHGGPDADLMFGNSGRDTMLGQTGADRMIGGNSDETADDAGGAGDLGPNTGDTMYGGSENDHLIGDNGEIEFGQPDDIIRIELGATGLTDTFGEDTMDGGAGDDVMHGQEGDDLMFGDLDYDQMFGDLGGDEMHGEAGPDYMLGDEGTITPATDPATFPTNEPGGRGAPNNVVSLDDPADNSTDANVDGGPDLMFGNSGDDHMYGGAAGDELSGGWADDVMEGNSGIDKMWGASETADDENEDQSDALDALLDGQDDMIGGSSPVNPETIDLDEGENVMMGNALQDVMTGDNAIIERRLTDDLSAWAIDNVTLGVARDVTLLDTEKTGADLDPVSGPDYMLGNGGNDRMYGEGGSDCELGNDEQDYVEGNQDTDVLQGNDDQDDLIGGSAVGGQPDDADVLYGGRDADVVMGDNAVVTRLVGVDPVLGKSPKIQASPYVFETNRLEIPAQRRIVPLDLATYLPDSAGGDFMSGGSESDVMFGQDENDEITGDRDDDYMEGNGHSDRLYGDQLVVPPMGCASDGPQLYGASGFYGQDDQIGGSSIAGHRDANDFLYGNDDQDFQLGDNGYLFRTIVPKPEGFTGPDLYATFEDANAATIKRDAVRFDVGVPASDEVWGNDYFEGHRGDDYQYGQDGDDEIHGNDDNDDQFGELGDDRMFGERGEDAMLGDRGTITDDLIEASDADDAAEFTFTTKQPPFLTYTGFRPGTLHRVFDLRNDGDGAPQEALGHDVGGADFMLGGPDHDTMHGADGDDLMNGEGDGDIVYGDDGSDVAWGGRGNQDPAGDPSDRGVNDEFVDYVFGGYGGDPNAGAGVITGGADILDFRPRPGSDPAGPAIGSADPSAWFDMTGTDDDLAGDPTTLLDNQHHQGIDWIYGGWDRDVLQGDVADNGPNPGDRLMDWDGAYNLYTHCNAAYGGYNDIRAISPEMVDFLQKLAFATGAGTSQEDVADAASSGFRSLALVYPKDLKHNSGRAYPTTPGHFDQISCSP